MTSPQQSYLRDIGLLVFQKPTALDEALRTPVGNGTSLAAIDLSELHFKFSVRAADTPTPNNCTIRIYNLSDDTVRNLTGKNDGVEFTRVQLLAGYQGGQRAVIFDGTIKQYRVGHESQTDSYLDILAADTDEGYNFGVCNISLAAGSTPQQRVNAATSAMNAASQEQIKNGNVMAFTGGVLPRGRVLFGMARDVYNCIADTYKATWSIQNGEVNIIPLQGYLPDDIVELSSQTGLIGYPEQTDQGITIRCLLNPIINVGGRVRIDNKTVNQLIAAKSNIHNIAYDQWTAIQYPASLADDGVYRVYVIDHVGDTRGQEFYSELTCLSIDRVKQKVLANQ